jgi:hypothetical protein
MVIFNSYVKLPEGNQTIQIFTQFLLSPGPLEEMALEHPTLLANESPATTIV